MGFLHVSEAATTARRALLESCDSTGGSDACRHVPVVVPEAPGDCELGEPVRLLRHPPDTAPPLARRAPDSLGEECTEGPQTGEAHVEAHLGDRAKWRHMFSLWAGDLCCVFASRREDRQAPGSAVSCLSFGKRSRPAWI